MSGQMEYKPKLNENYMYFLHYISSFESMYLLLPVLIVSFCFTLAFTLLIVSGVALIWKPNDLYSRLVDWFLCGGNTGIVNGTISECHSSQLSRTSFNIAKKKKEKNHSNRFSQTPYLNNGQGLLIKTRVFCWCSLITVLYMFYIILR